MIEDRQLTDFDSIVDFLQDFWRRQSNTRIVGRVIPASSKAAENEIREESLPLEAQSFPAIAEAIDRLIVPNVVKSSHPLFLAYVTPPSTDIGAFGAAIAAILNQNVMFWKTSPIGTAIEHKAVDWLAEIVGYGSERGGIITSGGSLANLYGLAVARRSDSVLGAGANKVGNYGDSRRMRVYCSEYSHHSIDKAAILMGLGKDSIVRIRCDKSHRINLAELRISIRNDLDKKRFLPLALIGNAGTRHACAFDDLEGLRLVADEFALWLHVDAAYGGFLRLASSPPPELAALPRADSVSISPHKLLFVPFDAGCFLVRDKKALRNTFGTEGEYRTVEEPPGDDLADLGMQLGRAFDALKVWLTIKYYGVECLGKEYTRLMNLANHLKCLIEGTPKMELLAPVAGTAVCFRWSGNEPSRPQQIDGINTAINRILRHDGSAYVDDVTLDDKRGFRVCMTNFRTETRHLDDLVERILSLGDELS